IAWSQRSSTVIASRFAIKTPPALSIAGSMTSLIIRDDPALGPEPVVLFHECARPCSDRHHAFGESVGACRSSILIDDGPIESDSRRTISFTLAWAPTHHWKRRPEEEKREEQG